MSNDEFGDRMKYYEGREAKVKFMPELPIVARIDGRTFSKFTKPFGKPFDQRMAVAMQNTTKRLVEDSHARIGYTQSDEITLIFQDRGYGSETFFGGRKQKLVSVLASMATAFFIRELDAVLQEEDNGPLAAELGLCTPHFDARVWQMPSRVEAANVLLWRAQDARKNGISSATRSMYSAKAMMGKNQEDMLSMMAKKGIYYHYGFDRADRFGTFWQRQVFTEELDDATWNSIPDEVRDKQSRMVTRSRVVDLELDYFGDYLNRPDIIFEGAKPLHIDKAEDSLPD